MKSLLRRWSRPPGAPAASRFIDGARMYCIGDIHGRADLLLDLQAQIEADARSYTGHLMMLYLGDYIDRGSQSRQVVEMLLERPLEGFETIHLKGNHEQALLDFLRYPEDTAAWLDFGGLETLDSYGLSLGFQPRKQDLGELARQLEAVLPDAHRAFFESGLLHWRGGDYLFVHAGIRPGVALDAQHEEDLMWIREEFTGSHRDHGAVVVHGHTISPEPEFRFNRIGLDTGAFHTGVLSCLVLEGADQRLLQTSPGPG